MQTNMRIQTFYKPAATFSSTSPSDTQSQHRSANFLICSSRSLALCSTCISPLVLVHPLSCSLFRYLRISSRHSCSCWITNIPRWGSNISLSTPSKLKLGGMRLDYMSSWACASSCASWEVGDLGSAM